MLTGLVSADCGSYEVTNPNVNLAPLKGYVEICSKDSNLCRVLTIGYPASTKTLGYFISDDDWASYQSGSRSGFSQYLIAQLASSVKPQEFEELKRYLHSKNGNIPDNTSLPNRITEQSKTNLGVISEHKNSITIGSSQTINQNNPPIKASITLLASNIAVLVNNSVLSLYVYRTYKGDSDLKNLKADSEQWLQCINKLNP